MRITRTPDFPGRPTPAAGRSRVALCLQICVLLTGCASIPEGRYAVDDISFHGADQVDEDDLETAIATTESPRFLGMFEGLVYDYSILNEVVLERDLARIERFYRARGYYEAHVYAARLRRTSDDSVRVEIAVREGKPVRVAEVRLSGLPDNRFHQVLAFAAAYGELHQGELFDEARFEAAAAAIRRTLRNIGYAWVQVERNATVDLVRRQARCTIDVTSGPIAELGAISLTGLGDLDETVVRDTLDLETGDRFDWSELDDAEQALLELGVFSSVSIEPDLGAGPPDEPPYVVPLEVKLAPGKLQRIELGGGVRLDALETDIHGLAAWESRNFLGGIRRFRVEAKPGVTLYPLRINNWVAPDKPLPKGQLRVRLEQPSLFEARTRGVVEATGAVVPVLLKTDPDPDDPVLGYLDTHGIVGVERRLWKLYGAVRQHVQYVNPFTYIGDLDPLLDDLVLGYPEIALALELRDDPISPHSGFYTSVTLQSLLFVDGRDLKIQPEVRGYLPLGDHFTIGARAAAGMLFPFNYGDTLGPLLADPAGARTAAQVRDLQLMYFRGLFAGGPGSNRGYPPRTISPHAVVPFLSPRTEAARIESECAQADSDPSLCSVPIGGLTLWEMALELRYPIYDPVSGAVFCDAADVAAERVRFRFGHLHLSCGSGLRYETPVGPIRLDVAYRIPGAQVVGGDEQSRVEGDPGDIFGAPINVSFGIGEAF